jgi:hypothetical protein
MKAYKTLRHCLRILNHINIGCISLQRLFGSKGNIERCMTLVKLGMLILYYTRNNQSELYEQEQIGIAILYIT